MNPLYNAFVYIVWFFATYYVVAFTLVLLMKRKEIYEDRSKDYTPKTLISVIVPAFNEEKKIADTIDSLKKVLHKSIEFIVISDGGTDRTPEVAREAIGNDSRFTLIDNKVNKGKAGVLNEGIKLAKGEFVACMDADSILEPDMFKKTLPYFKKKNVGAVTVSVEVRNPSSFLHRLIELEFTLGLSLFLKMATFFNAIFVTPGPFSMYRKSVLKEINGFDEDNITEDLEIAYRIHKKGYKIESCAEAKVHTILPRTFKEIYIQRRRWYSGAILTLHQHRKMLFNRKHGVFGFLIPYNYLLTGFGLFVFFSSIYLMLKQLINYASAFQYTGFNLWQRIMEFNIDFLALGNLSIVSTSSLLITLGVIILAVVISKKSLAKRKLGIIAFPLMFFYYQIFWIGSIISVIRGKKLKWR